MEDRANWEKAAFNRIELRKSFFQDGLEFEVQLSNAGEFSFHLIGGNSRRGSVWHSKRDQYNLWKDQPVHMDVDIVVNPISVFRKASRILLECAYRYRPPRIAFVGATERKRRIFSYFSKRLAKKLPGYCMVEHDGVVNFYRVKCPFSGTID